MVDKKEAADAPKKRVSTREQNYYDKIQKAEQSNLGDKYEIKRILGAGTYGVVIEAIHKKTNTKVAVKKITDLFKFTVETKRILREITLLRKCNHPNIIKILDLFCEGDPETFDTLYIVLEYCQSDLKNLFRSETYLKEVHLKTITYSLLAGLKYLHSNMILHRDLKPANILINEDCTVKICDFGLARSVDEMYDEQDDDATKKGSEVATGDTTSPMRRASKRTLTKHVVSRWYRAPEVILIEKTYTDRIDIWSIGCIFAELQGMLKENFPNWQDRAPLFPGGSCFPLSPEEKKKKGDEEGEGTKVKFTRSRKDQLNVIFSVIGTPSEEDIEFVSDKNAIKYLKSFAPKPKTDLREIYPTSSPDSLDFLEKCLKFNPKMRMSIDDLINHPYLQSVRDLKKEKYEHNGIALEFEQVENISVEVLREYFKKELAFFKKENYFLGK